MKVEMFNNHHYVRLKDVEKAITAAVRQREDEWRTQIEESVEKCSDCSAKVKKGILEHLEHN